MQPQNVYSNYPVGKAKPLTHGVGKYRPMSVLGASVGVLLMGCLGVWEAVSKVVEVEGDRLNTYTQREN
jgi:divalent metal cation (Fe/Co/Zn/Cd) transporter